MEKTDLGVKGKELRVFGSQNKFWS